MQQQQQPSREARTRVLALGIGKGRDVTLSMLLAFKRGDGWTAPPAPAACLPACLPAQHDSSPPIERQSVSPPTTNDPFQREEERKKERTIGRKVKTKRTCSLPPSLLRSIPPSLPPSPHSLPASKVKKYVPPARLVSFSAPCYVEST